ncbi:phosphotransferase family protein [Apiospora arundinis]
MPPKLRQLRMPKDDLAWDKNDEEVETWERSLNKAHMYHAIADLIRRYKPGEVVELHEPIRGGYNVFYRLEYKDGSSTAMRIPCKGIVRFPEEKIRYEAATMRYISTNTSIPLPTIYHCGTAAENTAGLGPFMIMDYVEHERTMSDALKDPALEPDDDHVLDPNIRQPRLEFLYGQMADILLQLSVLRFSRIGSLVQDGDGSFSVSGRPLIQNMNSLVEFTGIAPTVLPSQEYVTADEWYSALADMHFAQLVFQRNDTVLDEDDARDKYVARQLFRRLASEGKLSSAFEPGDASDGKSSFRLFSEDLRPSNVLVDKNDRVVGVIDWEFAYAAPPQFSSDPPWWLLLKSPDIWPGGYTPWMDACRPRLETFLHVLEDVEKKLRTPEDARCMATHSRLSDQTVPLSQQMRDNWEKQDWMINYAARNSWAFDFIYWRYLDERFFGPNEKKGHAARLDLLSQQELETMERLVELKMEQQKECTLETLDHDSATIQLAKYMI